MPDNVYADVVVCPASTLPTAPVEQALSITDPVIPKRVTIIIPAGHSGLTGIGIAFGHNVVLPSNAGAFISGDDDKLEFELGDYPAGVSWSAFTYNGDLQPHAWMVIFEGDNLTDTTVVAPAQPLTTGELAQAQADALTGP